MLNNHKYINLLKYSELGLAVPFSLVVKHTTVSSCSDTHISDYIEKKQKLDGKRELKLISQQIRALGQLKLGQKHINYTGSIPTLRLVD